MLPLLALSSRAVGTTASELALTNVHLSSCCHAARCCPARQCQDMAGRTETWPFGRVAARTLSCSMASSNSSATVNKAVVGKALSNHR